MLLACSMFVCKSIHPIGTNRYTGGQYKQYTIYYYVLRNAGIQD